MSTRRIVAAAVVILGAALALWAASQGPNSPTLGVNVAGAGTDWTNPTNIYTSNDVRATAAIPASGSSDYLRSTGYGFTIPTGATIDGIYASIERSQTGTGECYDKSNAVKLVKAGTETGTGLSSTYQYPTTDAYVDYGYSTYMWGTTWTPGEVNAANFGLSTMAQEIGGSSSCTARIDHMQLTVYFTEPAAGGRRVIRAQRRQSGAHGVHESLAACR